MRKEGRYGQPGDFWVSVPCENPAGKRPLFEGNVLRVPAGRTASRMAGSGRENIRHLVIPEGVREIEAFAFEKCGNLETVSLPGTLRTISYGAFREYGKLREIIIPEGVTGIGGYAFQSCKNLERAVLPRSIKGIGKGVFSGCSGLRPVLLPSSWRAPEKHRLLGMAGAQIPAKVRVFR